MSAAVYLIRKGSFFYRSNAQGYTANTDDAGRYSLEEAERLTHPNGPDGPRDGLTYVDENEVDPAPRGWVVGNAKGDQWRTWADGFSTWTSDVHAATRYARRVDAEAVHREDEDAWTVLTYAEARRRAKIAACDHDYQSANAGPIWARLFVCHRCGDEYEKDVS